MPSNRVAAVATMLATVAAVGIMGCRKSPTPGKDGAAASTNPLSVGDMTPINAKKWLSSLSGLAVSATGTPWAVGQFAKWLDFGSGTVMSSGSVDIYLAKLDPATSLATATFTFGFFNDNPNQPKSQMASGVAIASAGNVGIIGYSFGEIDFTANSADGSGPSRNRGSAGLDFLVGGSPSHFYGVFDGASTGAFATPKKVHMVDLGTGALMAVGSNPTQNAIAICGKTSKAVSDWADSGSNAGLITGGKAVAGGDMDIVVAKIDAASGAVIWGKQFGGAGNQICESVTIDNNGDVVLAGVYTGTLNFGGGSIALPVHADPFLALLYVAKLDGTSGAAVAAKTWGGDGRSNAYAVTVDARSNIIVAGRLDGEINFGSGVHIAKRGLTDAFVLKLTTALAPLWAKSFGDADFDQAVNSVGVSAGGDVFIGGSFEGRLGTAGLTSASRTAVDGFTAKLAGADGAILSAHAYGDGRGAQTVSNITVARTAAGALADSIFVGGVLSSEIKLGSATLSSDSPGLRASYIVRLIP